MKKLLVVVDYQNDFVDGALGFPKAATLEEGIYSKVKSYLENGKQVIFTYDTHEENYLSTREGENLPVVHCINGTPGHELYGRLKEFKNAENTIHINKSSFGVDPADMVKLRQTLGDVDNVEIVGVVTDICVISNVVTFQSTFVNANITVDSNLCASFDEEKHKKALEVMESIQAKVK